MTVFTWHCAPCPRATPTAIETTSCRTLFTIESRTWCFVSHPSRKQHTALLHNCMFYFAHTVYIFGILYIQCLNYARVFTQWHKHTPPTHSMHVPQRWWLVGGKNPPLEWTDWVSGVWAVGCRITYTYSIYCSGILNNNAFNFLRRRVCVCVVWLCMCHVCLDGIFYFVILRLIVSPECSCLCTRCCQNQTLQFRDVINFRNW